MWRSNSAAGGKECHRILKQATTGERTSGGTPEISEVETYRLSELPDESKVSGSSNDRSSMDARRHGRMNRKPHAYRLSEFGRRWAFVEQFLRGQALAEARRHAMSIDNVECNLFGEIAIAYRMSGTDSACTLHVWITIDDFDIDEDLIPSLKMVALGGADRSTPLRESTPVTIQLSAVQGTNQFGGALRSLIGQELKREKTFAFLNFSPENKDWQDWVSQTLGELIDEVTTGKTSEASRNARRAGREQRREKEQWKQELNVRVEEENAKLRQEFRDTLPLIITGCLAFSLLISVCCLIPGELSGADGFFEKIMGIFRGLFTFIPLFLQGMVTVCAVYGIYLVLRKYTILETFNKNRRKDAVMRDLATRSVDLNSSTETEPPSAGDNSQEILNGQTESEFDEPDFDPSVDNSLTMDELQRKYGYSKGSRIFRYLRSKKS